jgi:hypothetical protein
VAFVAATVSVEELPAAIEAGLAPMLTVGAAAAVTITVAVAVADFAPSFVAVAV